jgi:hypothetical protein
MQLRLNDENACQIENWLRFEPGILSFDKAWMPSKPLQNKGCSLSPDFLCFISAKKYLPTY